MERQKSAKSKALAAAGFLALAVLTVLWYWNFGCPFRFLTGICCPGCGMSRAVWHALHLDFAGAFYYHPLVFLLPLILLGWLLRKRLPRRLLNILGIAVLAVFLLVYLYRLFSGSEVVYARPEESVFSKLFHFLKEW